MKQPQTNQNDNRKFYKEHRLLRCYCQVGINSKHTSPSCSLLYLAMWILFSQSPLNVKVVTLIFILVQENEQNHASLSLSFPLEGLGLEPSLFMKFSMIMPGSVSGAGVKVPSVTQLPELVFRETSYCERGKYSVSTCELGFKTLQLSPGIYFFQKPLSFLFILLSRDYLLYFPEIER